MGRCSRLRKRHLFRPGEAFIDPAVPGRVLGLEKYSDKSHPFHSLMELMVSGECPSSEQINTMEQDEWHD